MSAGKSPGRGPENDSGAERKGSGSSGEGAGSAMEAMLRKRQMRVDPQPDPGRPPTAQQQDGQAVEE